jgi:hypothetical protein
MGSDTAILHEKRADSPASQDSLFDQPANAAQNPNRGPAPGVRNSDPISSKLAIDKITSNGRRLEVNNKILRFLREHPDREFTYKEIGLLIGHDPVDVMRRLNDLRHDHLATNPSKRACTTNGNLMLTWRAVRL